MQRTAVDPNRFAQDLFRPLPRRYDVIEELLSFGQNWRRRREIACALGVVGVATVGPGLIVFIVVGPLLALGYNLELFGGWMHTDLGFTAAWGSFPLLVGYSVQAERLDLTAMLAATAALGFSLAQRSLSTPARTLRRRVAHQSPSPSQWPPIVPSRDGADILLSADPTIVGTGCATSVTRASFD